ncbi:Fe(3+)-hydroxamate ABC transporter permease FhuB [Aquabacter sp. L1I39]|uniref:Fe(3+)-hydroxamate ABC transporter permease FhuB n=1 Tax=Aquabacter sp. L1I39 TaxID=2820278 RepID=UPI001ADB8A27|nr:Fe(3+)-hydroxamate ABC transporter permease FhuB [Aquabacter sp. L1I39]QTL06046.1 Fe(3+)-hydroxamate ABC transporter permease FhuB [Aquabacter sp. L1I39]
MSLSSMPCPRRGAPIWAGLCALAAGLFLVTLFHRPALPGDAEMARRLADVLLWYSLLPRAATALLAGAALGLSGALLQRVLRNPIADPSTLGIASGAQLALTLALGFAPGLLGWSREGVAFAGGAIAVSLVLAMSLRRRLDPVTVVISGMTVSLMAAAAASAIVLARGEYVLSVFIWGAGSLHQQNWSGALSIGTSLLVGGALAALLSRPLAVLSLDDAGARSLGVALLAVRVAVIALAVGLAATVISEVGVIGFVGLAAPAFARISGARTPGQMLLRAPLVGALLLSIPDGLVQVLGGAAGDAMPTGAAVGLIGGPVLLWLLPRVTATTPPAPASEAMPRRRARPGRGLLVLTTGTVGLGMLSLAFGSDGHGWFLATGALFDDLLPFRAPRIAAAAMAGGLLGAAGGLLQRLTGNPLAGPEVLGVSAGGGAGMALALILLDAPGMGVLMAGSAAGALAALLFILVIGAWTGFGPERMLLAGVALGCMCLAILSAVFAAGGWSTFILLAWLAGSTDRVGMHEAAILAGGGLLLLAPLPLLARWLDILPLGGPTARALGLPLTASRLVLSLLAALMTALASFFVGPLSLAGLLAPHLARLLGFVRPVPFLAASVLLGAVLLILADWLGRNVAFPYQIPVGFFAALIGGPYLIFLLQRGGARHG